MKLKFVFSLVVMLFFVFQKAEAQPSGGGPGGGADPDAPITGIEILLVAGGVLGMRKLVNSRKKVD